MKFNGKNIITDDDITLTGENIGEKLSDVLGELQSKTKKLESNVKWIYKYGGVGGSGGSGGSGGGSGDYILYAELDGKQLAGRNISLPSKGRYTLNFKIQRPNGANYNVVYKYTTINSNNVTSTIEESVRLTIDNNYEYSVEINLNNNDIITVTATDDIYNITKQASANYITQPYILSSRLANNEGEDLGNEMFVTTAAAGGLNVVFKYEFATNATTNYTLKFNMGSNYGTVTRSGTLTSSDKSGTITFDLREIGSSTGWTIEEKNSGYYSVEFEASINIEGQGIIPYTDSFAFNLIPQRLYLLVQPTVGTIYSELPAEETGVYKYNVGTVTFKIKPYFGTQEQSSCTIQYYVTRDGEDSSRERLVSTLRREESINIFSNVPGLNVLHLHLTCEGSNYPEGVDEFVNYYFYIKEPDLDLKWYDSTRTGTFNYYRGGSEYSAGFKSFYDITSGNPYQQTINKNVIEITDIPKPKETDTGYSVNFCMGIQYNEINDEDAVILRGQEFRNGQYYTMLEITQNTVTIGNTTMKYYLPKVEEYGKTGEFKFHLLNIVARLVKMSGTNYYYEVIIYVDGVPEGSSQNYLTTVLKLDKLILEKTNCIVNLLEISYPKAEEITIDGKKQYKTEDLSVYQYFLKYKNTAGGEVSETEKYILSDMSGFKINDNGEVTCSFAEASNVASHSPIPVIVFTLQDDTGSVKASLDRSYEETDAVPTLATTLSWSPGNMILENMLLPEGYNTAYFSISPQGSSTMSYKCKNFTLKINNSNAADTAPVYLFSPNFSTKDTKTFLPEEEFTLKADVVDSSHSNNTSVGKFVNEVTTAFDTNSTGQGTGYIKNCLDGFPILVFIQYSKKDSITGEVTNTCYYQGIYNFNLGRESHFNLGYKDLSVFYNNGLCVLPNAGNSFTFHQISKDQNNMKPGVLVAEIQGNSPYFDFSQWDPTILYKTYNVAKETYMFDDFVTGSGLSEAQAKSILANMVENVGKAGGYLFDNLLKKSFSNDPDKHFGYDDGYNAAKTEKDEESGATISITPLNQVPDYKKYYKREYDKATGQQIYTLDPSKEIASVSRNDLDNVVIGDPDDNVDPIIDFKSLSEYYTTCMAFGLVDSVQKNMNLKSWVANPQSDRAKFYCAFYDMDTCLGVNNAGLDVSYFAFSDYWSYTDVEESEGITKPSHVTIYRDYSPKSDDVDSSEYFDTASSYLFAIAKYTRTEPAYRENEKVQDCPRELWARWRANGTIEGNPGFGCLKDADTWMNKYFSNNLGSLPAPLVSLNYRNKYFVKLQNDENGFNELNWEKFNGSRIAKTRDWLNGRLHILDAYFNIDNKASNFIQYYDKDGNYVNIPEGETYLQEPEYVGSNYDLNNNPDIYLLQDIFSGGENNQGAGELDIRIESRELSPLYVSTANSFYKYLLGGNNRYHIVTPLSGTQTYKFGGSGAWTYLDSINTFNFRNLKVNSKYLEELNGSSNGVMTIQHTSASKAIIMPSLKTLSLTGPNYSGTLVLDGDDFTNLSNVDVSNTAINLEVNRVNCNKISISKMKKNSTVNIANCSALSEINFGTNGTSANPITTLDSCTISPIARGLLDTTSISSGGLTLNYSKIGNLTISNTTKSPNGHYTRLAISNDNEISKITVEGISSLYIYNCPKLSEIYITEPQVDGEGNVEGDYLEYISINNIGTSAIGDFKIGTADGEPGVASFEHCKYLRRIRLQNCNNVTAIKFYGGEGGGDQGSGNIYLDPSAFYGDANLETISSGQSTLQITGTSTFSSCPKYTMRDSTGGYTNLAVSSSITSLASTFSAGNTGGSLTLGAARQFVEHAVPNDNNVQDISGLFASQVNISYTATELGNDLLRSGHNYIDMSKFKKVTNVSSCFAWTGITAWHRKFFSFGSSIPDGTTSYTINTANYMIRGSSEITVCIDVFTDIISKASRFGWSYADGTRIPTFRVVNTSNQVLTTLNLKDLFHPSSKHPVTSYLGYIDFASVHTTINFTNLFDNWSNLTQIDAFMGSTSYASSRISNFNKTTTNGGAGTYLAGLTGLTYCRDSFNFSNESDPISLISLFNWNNFRNHSVNPLASVLGSDDAVSFHMYKWISYDNFKILMRLLLQGKLTGWSNMFNNCYILAKDDEVWDFSDYICTTITNMSNAFRNVRYIITGEDVTESNYKSFLNRTQDYVSLSDNFMASFPNVTKYLRTFYGMKFAKSLPLDFFKHRTGTVYSGRYIVTPGKELPEDDEYRVDKYSEYFSPIKHYVFDYKKNISDLRYTFWNVSWKRDDETGKNARCFDPLEEGRTELIANHYLYNDDTVISEIGLPYYTITQKSIQHVNPETGEISYETYDVYSTTTSQVLTDSTEISDSKSSNLKGAHVKAISINVGSGTWSLNNSNIKESSYNKLFVAPDIFYPVTSSCMIHHCFGNDSTGAEEVLEGIIPKNLVKNCKTADLQGLFQYLNIVPNWEKDVTSGDDIIHIYCYVPSNFTTRTSLNNAFTFHMNMPDKEVTLSGGGKEYNSYYILKTDSIPTSATSLANAFPNYMTYGFYYSPWPNPHTTDFGLHYSLMYDVINDRDGINMSRFTNLRADNLVGTNLSYFLTGRLFGTGYVWDNIKHETESNPVMSVFTDNNVGRLSMNLILPGAARSTSDFTNTRLITWSGGHNLAIKRSQIEGSNQDRLTTITASQGSQAHVVLSD